MKSVLFLCTGNSCRSQMAEGFARHYLSEKWQFFSAGTVSSRLNPYAVRVMEDVGVDISGHKSQALSEFSETSLDLVLTVCSDAEESCPYLPGAKIVHFGFDDPPKLTRELADEEEILAIYRRVRDEIDNFIRSDNFNQHLE